MQKQKYSNYKKIKIIKKKNNNNLKEKFLKKKILKMNYYIKINKWTKSKNNYNKTKNKNKKIFKQITGCCSSSKI